MGRGTINIVNDCANYGIPEPNLKFEMGAFWTTFYKLKDNATVNDRQKQIIEKIANYKNITINQLAEICNVSRDTIIKDIKKLKELKIIERIGSDKSGYWRVNSKPYGDE